MRRVVWLVVLTFAAGAAAVSVDLEFNPVRTRPPAAAPLDAGRIIVKLRVASAAAADSSTDLQFAQQRLAALAARTALSVRTVRPITARLHAVQLEPGAEATAAVLTRLRADPEVEYAEADARRYAHASPNDPLFPQQWYLQNPTAGGTPSAIDALDAWSTTTGSASLVIADLDTGVRFDHPDLLALASGGRLLPGYDFISDVFVANDGGGRDADASDPGDWMTSQDLTSHPSECSNAMAGNSSWHGTRVAGILGALTNNATGIAGVTWQTRILPLRVLGKCGGLDSDIVAAMLWAAGIAVAGVPANANPAKIVNMSLGGTGSCPAIYQETIDQLRALGVLVVVSAGNEGGQVDAPANCVGAVGVAGLRHAGTKVGFSSLGPELALGAPGGNCVNTGAGQPCLFSIETTFNLGTTVPAANSYTDQINNPNLGTSFSAPQVSGIAALMAAVNGNLNTCQLSARLKEGALPYPQTSAGATTQPPMCHVPANANDLQNFECICTLDGRTCGAGMANAPGALAAAARPIATLTLPASVSAGHSFTLQGGGGAISGHTIQSFKWTNPSGETVMLSGANTATATVSALPACGLATVRLTVTDDQVPPRQDTADAIVGANSVTSTAPAMVNGAADCSLPALTVALCPASASVAAGGAPVAFRADVAGTTDDTVSWQVNGVAGGDSSDGTISTTGTYTPPTCVPAVAAVTVSAVSAADGASSAESMVTLTGNSCSGSSGGGGGGGGGSLDLLSLVMLAGLAGLGAGRYRSRSAASSQARCARR